LFNIFVKDFAFLNNTKKREILNSIIVKIKNLDNIVKNNNNKQETRYKTYNNAKELNYNYYKATNNNNNSKENNKNKKAKNNNNKINKNNNKIENNLN